MFEVPTLPTHRGAVWRGASRDRHTAASAMVTWPEFEPLEPRLLLDGSLLTQGPAAELAGAPAVIPSGATAVSDGARAAPTSGSAYYVRPYGGSYGAENGTSYADAWDGLGSVVWGAGGVGAGDTLYVCGTHPSPDHMVGGAPVNGHTSLAIGASGAVGAPITIRGDYPVTPAASCA